MNLNRVLVVHKKSLYQIYVEEHHDASIETSLKRGEISAQRLVHGHKSQQRALDTVLTTLQSFRVDVKVAWRGNVSEVKDVDLVITVGGDGTLLDTSHKIHDTTPIMGINSQPEASAGVLCAGTAQSLSDLLKALQSDRLKPVATARLRIQADGKELLSPCLNDVLIAHPSPAELSRFDLKIRQQSGEIIDLCAGLPGPLRNSGLWVATATGSTAALLSAGGRALPPTSRELQFWVREPYFQPTEERRIVAGTIAEDQTLEVTNWKRRATIWGDGAHHRCSLRYEQTAVLDVHAPPLQLIRHSYQRNEAIPDAKKRTIKKGR